MDDSMVDSLPKVGVMAEWLDGTPVAAGYLRVVEGGYAIIDSLIADPASDKTRRNEALDGIITRLIVDGRRLGMKSLLAICELPATIERAKTHGFDPSAFMALTLQISSGHRK